MSVCIFFLPLKRVLPLKRDAVVMDARVAGAIRVCSALLDAGGVMEISRWRSETTGTLMNKGFRLSEAVEFP